MIVDRPKHKRVYGLFTEETIIGIVILKRLILKTTEMIELNIKLPFCLIMLRFDFSSITPLFLCKRKSFPKEISPFLMIKDLE